MSMSTAISRINSSRSGRSSGSAGSCECVGMEEDRDGGGRKGRVCYQSNSDYSRQDEEEGVKYKCESCNKVSWFESFSFLFFLLYWSFGIAPFFSGFSSLLFPTNHLTS